MSAGRHPTLLDIDSVAYRYGRATAPALVDVSFSVRRGVVMGLVGPNGSGKTTLFRLILGLVRPQRGRIRVDGHDPAYYRRHRGVGYLPERVPLPFDVTVRHFAEYVGRLAGLRHPELGGTVDNWMGMLEIGARANAEIGTLSHGYRQRVGLLAALLGEPELLLFDEPGTGLDPISVGVLRSLLRLLRRQGRAILVSSHNLLELGRVCDEVVILAEGRTLGQRTRRALVAEPDVWVVQAATQGNESVERFGGVRLARDETAFADAATARRFAAAAVAMGTGVYSIERRPYDLELLFHELIQRRGLREGSW